MNKVNSAYLICNPIKFPDIDTAEKELKRLRSLCIRLKSKDNEDNINFVLGCSVTNSQYFGKMGYDKPKNKGGKKKFNSPMMITKRDRLTGELFKTKPNTEVEPHIHMMVDGMSASSYAEKILDNLRKRNTNVKFTKTRLKTKDDVIQVTEYIESQCVILRRV